MFVAEISFLFNFTFHSFRQTMKADLVLALLRVHRTNIASSMSIHRADFHCLSWYTIGVSLSYSYFTRKFDICMSILKKMSGHTENRRTKRLWICWKENAVFYIVAIRGNFYYNAKLCLCILFNLNSIWDPDKCQPKVPRVWEILALAIIELGHIFHYEH